MKYAVQWPYRTDRLGPWVQGEVVDLDEETAEWVNRDSPGVLVRHVDKPPKDRLEKGARDRQVKAAQTRAGAQKRARKRGGT